MKSIFDYALVSIGRFGWKNISIALIFALLVWLLSSVIFITSSLRYEFQTLAKQTPSLVANKQIAGRYYPLYESDVGALWDMPGIAYAKGRVWGQYYLTLKRTFVTILGLEPYEESYTKNVSKIANMLDNNLSSSIIISKSMKELLKPFTSMSREVSFEKPDGGYMSLKIGGIFKDGSELFNNDVIITDTVSAREILGLEEGVFTDIIIKVANPNEVDFISAKLAYKYPQLKLTTKDEILKDYELLYQFKSGWFLLIFIVSFITFAIILYDKSSGLRSEEKREISILKALGWEINHIIYYKLLESFILSLLAFLFGLSLALFYVYFLDAPLLKYVFTGYSELKQPFSLSFVYEPKAFALLFFSTVPLYIAVCIIPSWKAATKDVNEVLR